MPSVPVAIGIRCVGPTGPAGGGGGPTGPDFSVQFRDGAAFNGSTDVGISQDSDQVLVVGLDNTGPVPVTGNMRYVAGALNGAGFIARVRSGRTNPGDERDVGFYYAYTTDASDFAGEQVVIGRGGWNDGVGPLVYQPDLCPAEIIDAFNGGLEQLFTTPTPDANQNGTFLFQVDRPGDPVGSFPFARLMLFQRYVNVMLYPVNFASIENALGGGEGVVVWGEAVVVPTTNPFAGQIIAYVDPADVRPYFRGSAGDVRPLYALSAEGHVTTDQSTSSASFADLVSVAVSTQSGVVDIIATSVSIPNGGNGFFQLAVDGVAVPFSSAFIPNQVDPENIAIVRRVTGLAVGSHTFSLQWRTSSGTLSCPVGAQPTIYQANILVRPSS